MVQLAELHVAAFEDFVNFPHAQHGALAAAPAHLDDHVHRLREHFLGGLGADAHVAGKQQVEAHDGCLRSLGMEGGQARVIGHLRPEQGGHRVTAAHLAHDQPLRGHTHGIIHRRRQGVRQDA